MQKPIQNISLREFNTFGIDVTAKWFLRLRDSREIHEFIHSEYAGIQPRFILGGGSNVVFTDNYDGLILKPSIKGIEIIQQDKEHVLVRAGANEDWDGFVAWCVNNNFAGIENLSFIPGSVGASPVQNIGAYGVEVKDRIHTVEGIELKTGNKRVFTREQCVFSYRNSIFKNKLKGQYIITNVNFRLDKKHTYITGYGTLEKELDSFPETTINNIRKAVIAIRRSKLPDPVEFGNAGSFFKNPVVTDEIAENLLRYYPKMPYWKLGNGSVKLSAAWLIEMVKWKGKKIGNVGTHKNQPLVIINLGNANGTEVAEFARKIQKIVVNKFAISLEPEVTII